jgi:DNA polymerase III sliding clamp (beta) subunit (PCNA family)
MQTIKTKVLLDQLVRAMPGLASKKDFVAFYEMFSFYNQEIITFNEHTSVRVPIQLDLECSVLAKEFHDIIAKITSEEIQIGIDQEQLKITAPNITAKMNVSIKDITKSILNSTETDNLVWKPLPAEFMEGVALCSISVGRTNVLDWMTALTIDGAEMLSTDSYRISNYTLPEPIDGKYHIPHTAIEGAIDQVFKEYATSKQWFHLRAEDGLIYSAKRVNIATMPEMLKYFVMEGISITFPAETEKVIDLVSVISEAAKTDKRAIAVELSPGMMRFRSHRQDLGWIEQAVPIEYAGEAATFYINPDFAKRIIKETRETVIGPKFCKFTAGNFKHLVATQRKES